MSKNPPDRLEVPQGLTVDIETNDKGKVNRARINEPGRGYVDGDIVVISGGNGNAYLRVRVSDKNKWTSEYIPTEVLIMALPAARVGDLGFFHCSVPFIAGPGAVNVTIEGQPAARMSDIVGPHFMPGFPSWSCPHISYCKGIYQCFHWWSTSSEVR